MKKMHLQAVGASTAAEMAQNIAGRLGVEKEQIQASLDNNLPDKIASIIASMCGYDCEQKKLMAQSITQGYMDRINNIHIAESTLGDIVKGKYLEIVSNLKFDLRAFLVRIGFTQFFTMTIWVLDT